MSSKGKSGPSIRQVVVEGYEKFWSTVQEMEIEAGNKNLPLVVIVESSPQPDGTVWCRDCGLLDKMLRDKLNTMKVSGIIVKGKAGNLEEWLSDENRFKSDETLRINAIPTAYRWKDGQPVRRLEAPDLLNAEKFKKLFTD